MAATELDHQNLRARLAAMLRDDIFSGKLRPGDRVVESQLAKELALGQPSIREGLQVLEHEGLITRLPRRGCHVTHLTDEDKLKIYEVRFELEPLAVARIPASKLDEVGAELRHHLDTMENAADELNLEVCSRADLEFHRVIWRASGNEFLVRALEAVTVPLFAFNRIWYHQAGKPANRVVMSITEHARMIEIIGSALDPGEKGQGIREILERFSIKEMQEGMVESAASHAW